MCACMWMSDGGFLIIDTFSQQGFKKGRECVCVHDCCGGLCGDLLDLAVAASPPPSFSRLFSVNYIKGSSYRINDIPLFCNRVKPLCVYVWVRERVVSEWRMEAWACQSNYVNAAIGGFREGVGNSETLKTAEIYKPWHVQDVLVGSELS